MHRTLLPVVLALLAAAPLAGQTEADEPLVELGMRVRVTAAPIEWIPVAGQLVSLSRDSLLVLIPGRPRSLSIATADVRLVEVSLGPARTRWTALGAATGAAAGVATSRAFLDHPPDSGLVGSIDGVAVTLGGMLGGALLGWLVAPERWRPAVLPEL